MLLVLGGIFFLFKDTIFGWITKFFSMLKNGVVSTVTYIATKGWEFLKGLWDFLKWIGGALYNVVKWLTDPDGFVVKTVWTIVKAVMWVKSTITGLVKQAGYDSVDAFCMFLAGDFLGLALRAIAGLVVKLWNWIKKFKFVRMVFGLVKGYIKGMMMIYKLPLTFADSIWKASKAVGKFLLGFGNLKDIGKGFAQPWLNWWNDIKSIFAGLKQDVGNPGEATDFI